MEIAAALVFIILSLILIKRRNYAVFAASLYLPAVICLTFFIREPMPLYHYSLSPFSAARKGIEFGGGFIAGVLSGNVRITSWGSIKGIVLNVLLFVPFGFLISMIWRKKNWTWWKVMLFGLAGSFLIEVIQLITRLGYADVDDLINNTIGAVIGYLLFKTCLVK